MERTSIAQYDAGKEWSRNEPASFRLLKESELEDMNTTQLTNDFIETHLHTNYNDDYARRTLQAMCDSFVHSFSLDSGDWVVTLRDALQECDAALHDMETILGNFAQQLEAIQRDIEDVRHALAFKSIQLHNIRNTEGVLWSAVNRLVVPPAVVQVLMQTSVEDIGPEFSVCIEELLKFLQYRRDGWQPIVKSLSAQVNLNSHIEESVTNGLTSPENINNKNNINSNNSNHFNCSNGRVDEENNNNKHNLTERNVIKNKLHLTLRECRMYNELTYILDGLALYACVKIKSFLSRKIELLTVPNTNVCIQQEKSLQKYAFYVYFLRISSILLRHDSTSEESIQEYKSNAHKSIDNVSSSPFALPAAAPAAVAAAGHLTNDNNTITTTASATNTSKEATTFSSFPHRIANALYHELRREYCAVMSHLYLTKMQDYTLTCNSLEYSTNNHATTSSSFITTTALGKFFASSQQTNSNNNDNNNNNGNANSQQGGSSSSNNDDSAAGSQFGRLFASSENQASYLYVLPLLSNIKIASSYLAFRLGERGSIFHHPQLPSYRVLPIIPVIEQAHRRKHSYEETFRSVVYLLTDIVTHEYLFTLQFFAGDSSIYAEVLRPTVQFVVDYLVEVVLNQSVTSNSSVTQLLRQTPHTSTNVNATNDCYGLLILIRHCYAFRGVLEHERRLTSLHGFHDSLLLQLWPVFKRTFDKQINSFAKLQPAQLRTTMVHLKRIDDQLCFVLPLTKSFTEFMIAILGLVLGAMITEERQRTAAEQRIAETHTVLRENTINNHKHEIKKKQDNNTNNTQDEYHNLSIEIDRDRQNSLQTMEKAESQEHQVDVITSPTVDAIHVTSNANMINNGEYSPEAHRPVPQSSLSPSLPVFSNAIRNTNREKKDQKDEENDDEEDDDVMVDTYQLRREALATIASELSSDAADSNSRFAVVLSNISFMQVQMVDLLEHTAQDIIRGISQSTEMKELYTPMESTFVINNLYFVLETVRRTPLLVDGTYSSDYNSDNRELFSESAERLREQEEQQEQEEEEEEEEWQEYHSEPNMTKQESATNIRGNRYRSVKQQYLYNESDRLKQEQQQQQQQHYSPESDSDFDESMSEIVDGNNSSEYTNSSSNDSNDDDSNNSNRSNINNANMKSRFYHKHENKNDNKAVNVDDDNDDTYVRNAVYYSRAKQNAQSVKTMHHADNNTLNRTNQSRHNFSDTNTNKGNIYDDDDHNINTSNTEDENRESKSNNLISLTDYADFTILQTAYERHRSLLVEHALQLFLPSFYNMVKQSSNTKKRSENMEEELIRVADDFIRQWRDALTKLCELLRKLIAESAHAQEIIAQACMECLLYNTRFHTLIAQSIETHKDKFADRSLRSLIVSNQQLLQHMRTFASLPVERELKEESSN